MIVEINDELFIDTDEVVSVEHENNSYETPSGGYVGRNFNGSRVILKNGRKIYVNGMKPKELMEKLGLLPKKWIDANEKGRIIP